MSKGSKKVDLTGGAGMTVLILWALIVLLPVLWTVLAAFRTEFEMQNDPFAWPESLTPGASTISPVHNFQQAWHELQFASFFRNSVSVVVVSMLLILVLATPAAYALARLQIRGRTLLLLYFISGMMIPAQLVLVPLFFQYTAWSEGLTWLFKPLLTAVGFIDPKVTLHDSHVGLILIYVATSLSFSIFLLTNFFRTLPKELYEAGIVDGCSEWHVFWHVMVPTARSGLITVAIFNFIALWNEYLFALVFIHDDSLRTLPLGLAALSIESSYRSGGSADAGVLFAGLVIVMLPTLIVYLLLQKKLVRGMTLGAVKG
jgi:ABC-type glycerol-3-phosphate transport system permease component